VVVVKDRFTKFSIRSGTSCGVTCSTTVKLGSSRANNNLLTATQAVSVKHARPGRIPYGRRRQATNKLPASAIWYSSGTGMFDADSLSRCKKVVVSFSVRALVFTVVEQVTPQLVPDLIENFVNRSLTTTTPLGAIPPPGMFDADSLSRCKKVVVSFSVRALVGRYRGMVVDMCETWRTSKGASWKPLRKEDWNRATGYDNIHHHPA
jgi:hypothetical protein